MKSLTVLVAILVGVLISGCAVNPVTGKNELALMNVSVEQEIQLGGQAYTQALQKMGGEYPDPVLGNYVERVGQRVARVSHRPELKYQFKVVNDSSPNAFALPGGYIAITRGLLITMENEAQLAAVLAHEVGHVTARHSVQELQRSSLIGTTVGLLSALAGGTGYGELLTQVGGLTADLLSKSYSRDQEYEADSLSVDYLIRAGYSAQGAVQLQNIFITKFENGNNADWLNNMFRTHPFSRDRLAAIQNRIATRYAGNRNSFGLDAVDYRNNLGNLNDTVAAYELYDRAQEAEVNGQLDAAIELYHKAMQSAPDHGLLLTSLGMAYLRKEDKVPARRYLLKAVNADSGYFKSRMGLGYIYLENHQAAEAAEQLETSIKLLPTVEGTYLLAEAEEQQGHLPRARDLYQTVVQADRDGKLGQSAAVRLRSMSK
ncbi:MAG: M48 family metalloprotease [Desulfuromonadales bacterium]|nr:M48 family metalloprotease [Desulfuromonadales bacterium]MBN2793454.1 M48 family metalloprotease [Desulfuromonadales bacterium]